MNFPLSGLKFKNIERKDWTESSLLSLSNEIFPVLWESSIGFHSFQIPCHYQALRGNHAYYTWDGILDNKVHDYIEFPILTHLIFLSKAAFHQRLLSFNSHRRTEALDVLAGDAFFSKVAQTCLLNFCSHEPSAWLTKLYQALRL